MKRLRNQVAGTHFIIVTPHSVGQNAVFGMAARYGLRGPGARFSARVQAGPGSSCRMRTGYLSRE